MTLDPGRPAAAVLHLLPPGAGAGGAGGADAAHARRPLDAGDRARLPRRGDRDAAAARPRQAQDPRGADPLRGAGGRASCRSGCRPCWPRSTSSSTRATRPPRTRRSSGASCAPRRSAWRASSPALMPDEPEALGLLALMLLHDSRRDARTGAAGRARAARGPGPLALGPRRDRRGARPRAAGAAPRPAGPYALQAAIAAEHARAPSPARPTGVDRRPLRARWRRLAARPWSSSTGPRRSRWPRGPSAGSS